MLNHDNYNDNFENINVPEDTRDILIASMDRAAARKRKLKRRRAVSCIAVALAVVIAVPNLSPTAAKAMESVPVLGNLFRIITVNDYHDNSGRYTADVDIPYISASDEISQREADKINRRINETCEAYIAQYEQTKEELAGEGYEDLYIKGEIVSDSDDYFTLKLILYQGAGSGYEQNDYYTIDKKTGGRVMLSDILPAGYKETINKEIIRQMNRQMKEDDSISYFIGDEWDGFTTISDDQDFYLDENGDIVICFDEYEVAPGYMGCVSFTVSRDLF